MPIVAQAVAPLPVVEAHCLRLAHGLGLLAAAIGVCVLTGWTFHLPALMTVSRGLVAMKANTAVGLILGGLSLFLVVQLRRDHRLRALPTVLATIMALIGGMTLIEYLTGHRLRIDELLFKDRYDSDAPGRMAPITTVNFVCLGVALVLLRRPRSMVLAQALAAVLVFTSVLVIIGYSYGVASLY